MRLSRPFFAGRALLLSLPVRERGLKCYHKGRLKGKRKGSVDVLQDWIIQTMDQFGYFGIFLLIALENIFPPIPSEVILTFGGFLTTYTQMQVWGVILAATAGSVAGAIVLYCVGRFFSQERIEGWLDGRLGRILHFKKEDVEKAARWFERKGKLTVFFCRCIPIVRSLISIPAGMTKMGMGTFLLFTTAGTFVWNIVLVYLGAFAGESWEKIVGYIGTYSHVTLVVLILVLAAAAGFFYYKRILGEKHKNR